MKLQSGKKEAITVLTASILFNLSIQVLYIWSLLKDILMKPEPGGGLGWSSGEAGLPYTLAIIFFAIGVLLGGRIQDKTGPRIVATAGGAMVGLGLVISGLAGDSPFGAAVGYGVISGLGIGFGYGSVLPACLKWFHPSKKGLIGGLVLGAFGLASVHYAIITSELRRHYGIQEIFIFTGIAVAVISVAAAQFIRNPEIGYEPAATGVVSGAVSVQTSHQTSHQTRLRAEKPVVDYQWKEMLKTRQFYLIFTLFLFCASIGLMLIGNLARISNIQAGVAEPVVLISVVAVVNALGRVIGGFLSDKIGRVCTLFIAIVLQMLNMAGFIFYQNIFLVTFGFIVTGLCFGTFLAVFPALTADRYGLKNYGVNYGIVYLAYGFAGTAAPVIADYVYMSDGDFHTAYIICAILMVLMIPVNYLLKEKRREPEKGG